METDNCQPGSLMTQMHDYASRVALKCNTANTANCLDPKKLLFFFWCLTSSKLHFFDRHTMPYNEKGQENKYKLFWLLFQSITALSALRTLFSMSLTYCLWTYSRILF